MVAPWARVFPYCIERDHWQWEQQAGAKLVKSSLTMKLLIEMEILRGGVLQ